MEAEPPGHAFPGGAWEREVWHEKPVCSLPARQERSVSAPVAAGLRAGRLKLVHKGASLIQTRPLVPYRLSEELWEFAGGLFPIVIPVKTGIQDHPCFRMQPRVLRRSGPRFTTG
jgi:hypothetical protein